MADLGFFDSVALGMIAGDTVSRDWPRLAAEAGVTRRFRNDAASQDQLIGELITENDHLRTHFEALAAAAQQVERKANEVEGQVAQLRQELAHANERARQAEAREAEARKAHEQAEAYITLLGESANAREGEINRLYSEIERLKRG